jgi:hypothetical protein
LKCDDLDITGLPECAESCGEMFGNLERDVDDIRRAAKDMYDLDVPAMPPRK